MKKLFILAMTVSVTFFSACNFGVDEQATESSFVSALQDVRVAEEDFYNEYWDLKDGSDVTPVVSAAEKFEKEVADLEELFDESKFLSAQQVFVDEYEDEYKPLMDKYAEDVRQFAEKIKNEGFVFDEFEDLFARIDANTTEFVRLHEVLLGKINQE